MRQYPLPAFLRDDGGLDTTACMGHHNGAENDDVDVEGWSVFDMCVCAGKGWETAEDRELRLCRLFARKLRRLPTLPADPASPEEPWTA
eukprot:749757-Lingulodinium_polyedra.AAC.1